MLKPVTLITDPVSPAVHDALDLIGEVSLVNPADDGAFRRELARASAVIVRSQLPHDAFDAAPHMLLAVRHGAGIDMIPLDNATANGVAVAAVPGANRSAVAEYAIGQMIAFCRRLPQMDGLMRTQGWDMARSMASGTTEIGGKTLGIVGLGAVGTRLAEIANFGFGMRILGFRRNMADVPNFIEPAQLAEVFDESDFVTIACPLTEQTLGMIDADLLSRMKPQAVLVNLARGPVVDNAALLDILEHGRIGGAILDVFDPEPLPQDSPFLGLQNVLMTPHTSGISRESAVKLGFGAVAEIERVFAGEHPHSHYNPQCWDITLERWRSTQSTQN